jgi:Lrp/AsnC family leucine-responsive transcriptional regulator
VEEIDRKIVSLLARNGRMSFTELARQAGLSVSAVHQRVRRLEQDGVIKGYVAMFNPEDVGLPLTAFVSVKPFDAAAPDDLPQRLEHLTAIEACYSVAGEENYILKVRVASPDRAGGPAVSRSAPWAAYPPGPPSSSALPTRTVRWISEPSAWRSRRSGRLGRQAVEHDGSAARSARSGASPCSPRPRGPAASRP